MALSIVSWRGEQDGRQEFDAEIGANRYYAWGVGAGVTKHDGVRLLASRALTSPVLGPLEPGERGRVVLRVPSDARDDDGAEAMSGKPATRISRLTQSWAGPHPDGPYRPPVR